MGFPTHPENPYAYQEGVSLVLTTMLNPTSMLDGEVSACRCMPTSPLVGWLVMRDPPDYPDKITARLVTEEPTFHVLVADTMGELHAALPPGLVRLERRPMDPPEVVEIWFST